MTKTAEKKPEPALAASLVENRGEVFVQITNRGKPLQACHVRAVAGGVSVWLNRANAIGKGESLRRLAGALPEGGVAIHSCYSVIGEPSSFVLPTGVHEVEVEIAGEKLAAGSLKLTAKKATVAK